MMTKYIKYQIKFIHVNNRYVQKKGIEIFFLSLLCALIYNKMMGKKSTEKSYSMMVYSQYMKTKLKTSTARFASSLADYPFVSREKLSPVYVLLNYNTIFAWLTCISVCYHNDDYMKSTINR